AWLRGHSAGGGPYRVNNYVPHEALLFGLNPSVYLYWMISLSMNFVYNNPLTNYPGYIFAIIISILLLSIRTPETGSVSRSRKNVGYVQSLH
ncbi:hypothetical protein ACOS18_23015, partial [Serratia sp. CY53125]